MLREIFSVFGLLGFWLLVWAEWKWKVFWEKQLPELFLTLKACSEPGCRDSLAHPYQIPFSCGSSASRILSLTTRLLRFLTPFLETLAIVHVKWTFDNEVCVNLGIFLNCWAVLAKSNIRILIVPSKSLLAENLLHLEKHNMFSTVVKWTDPLAIITGKWGWVIWWHHPGVSPVSPAGVMCSSAMAAAMKTARRVEGTVRCGLIRFETLRGSD